MATTANPGHCKARKRNGQPCAGYALNGSDFCFAHDPARARARAAARRAGGKARHGRTIGSAGPVEPVSLASVADALKLLERTVNDTLRLENSLSRAGIIARLVTAFVAAFQVGELEPRLAALEEAIRNKNYDTQETD